MLNADLDAVAAQPSALCAPRRRALKGFLAARATVPAAAAAARRVFLVVDIGIASRLDSPDSGSAERDDRGLSERPVADVALAVRQVELVFEPSEPPGERGPVDWSEAKTASE